MERSKVRDELRQAKRAFRDGARSNVLDEMMVMGLLRRWARWTRIGNGSKLGYAKRTLEGRMMDGELVGIKGAGEYRPPSDKEAQKVEDAVKEMSVHNPNMAFVLRRRLSAELSPNETAIALSVELGETVGIVKVRRLEDRAVAWMDARLLR
jgi:hypothetical protein